MELAKSAIYHVETRDSTVEELSEYSMEYM